MSRRVRHRFALALAATLAAGPVWANCADHASVVERLASGYGETRQSIALAPNGAVVEVFASLDTGTWTITVTAPGGPTCLVAAGIGYERINEGPSPPGQDM